MEAWSEIISDIPLPSEQLYKITITCEECDHRNPVERFFYAGEIVTIICHDCELPIHSEVKIPTENAAI